MSGDHALGPFITFTMEIVCANFFLCIFVLINELVRYKWADRRTTKGLMRPTGVLHKISYTLFVSKLSLSTFYTVK